jgi:hypothetical protein
MNKSVTDDVSPLKVDLDKPVPPQAIRWLVHFIADKFDPDKIILFGSYASGQPKPWSRHGHAGRPLAVD